ncbi:MAG: NUDIX hydrolase [Steroidobacteraceae bacterium]
MTWRPDLTVAAIVQHDHRFLVVEELIRDCLVFNQPAGHVEDGESILEAVIRETLEETAWQFTPRQLLGVYQWRQAQSGQSFLRMAIIGDVTGHDPARSLDTGIVAAHWMDRDALLAQPQRLRSPLVMRCIDDYLAGQRHSLSALHFLAAQPLPQG